MAVGIGTALADDPQLTARIEGVSRQPRRVVFDSEARLPVSSRLVAGRGRGARDGGGLAGRFAHPRAGAPGGRRGRDRGHAARTRPRAWPHALDELGARDIQSLLLEGGPHLAGAFLEAGEIDEARIFVAPVLAGGREARTVVEGIGAEAIAGAVRALSRWRPSGSTTTC